MHSTVNLSMENLKFRPRKLMHSNYSRVIAIPPLWLENVKLDFGDYVDLTLGSGGELILTPHREVSMDGTHGQ